MRKAYESDFELFETDRVTNPNKIHLFPPSLPTARVTLRFSAGALKRGFD